MPQHSLEQEAMERVRRMYAPFDGTRAEPPRPAPENRKTEAAPRAEPPADSARESSRAKPEKPAEKPEHPRQNSLLDVFMQDKDQSLILLLMVLLMKDGADMNLMLALMYLLIE